MDHLELIGHPTTLTAYDEGRYPNPDNKPSGSRPKKVTMSQRKQIPTKEPHRHVCYTTREHHSPSFMGRFLRPTTNTEATPLTDGQEHANNDSLSQRSIIISDASQHIDRPRTDLQNATLWQVTPATLEEQTPVANSNSNTNPSRRRQRKGNYKKRKKQSKRSNYKHSSSSDGSYSSSSSDEDSSCTSDDSNESILAFPKGGTTNNVKDIKNAKKQFNTSKRIGKQVKKLTTAAKMYELKEFIISRGTIDQRKAHFLYRANTLREMLTPMYRYQALLRDLFRHDNQELTITANTALGLFLRLKLRQATIQTIEASMNRQQGDNGFLILQYIFGHYGNTTDVDISNASQRLENNTVERQRHDIHIYTTVQKRLSIVQESIAARSDIQHTTFTDDYITMLYLRLLITSLPKQHDLRTAIQTLYAKCQSDMTSLNTLDTNVSTIQHKFFQLQLTEDAHIDATDHHVYHHPHRPLHNKSQQPHTPKLDTTKKPRKLTSNNLHCRLAHRQRSHCPHDSLY
jgi:hypothetical protein